MNTKTKAQHTAGEWRVNNQLNSGEYEIESERGESICLGGSVFGTPEENKANARLIAVAPELLQAAHDACIVFAELKERGELSLLNQEPWEGLKQAIAKAKGE